MLSMFDERRLNICVLKARIQSFLLYGNVRILWNFLSEMELFVKLEK